MDEGVFQIHLQMCEEQFKNQNLIEQECEQCGKIIIKFYINDHLDICEGNFWIQVKCPYCSLAFLKADLKNHISQCTTFQQQQIKEQQGVVNCTICLEDIEENKIQLDCSHFFHKDCINNWIQKQNKCPVCKKRHNIIS
ncbi:unnamed protein product [Paramecium pentaurelia]|uniref:RING-type domain-containing protein n=1 Tax=Paramecium pentaurelia TaxID=43138 RepID=A0A8S1VHM2_9CILI|nr:unnamed protein product [Paramecium pentaurelia]